MKPLPGEVQNRVEINSEQPIEDWKNKLQNTWVNEPCNWTLCLNCILQVRVSAYKGSVNFNNDRLQ